jgi:Ni/Fe-hydrogenase subunit HybB-like protein
MAVLLLEIWLEFRADIVRMAQTNSGWKRLIYKALTLGSMNVSPAARRIDEKVGYAVTVIGVPSAFLLHGYVGFIFGSVKANPWWSSPLMPVVFLFSAMVSGIAGVLVLFMAAMKIKKMPIDMPCVDTIAKYLFYTFIIDFSLEMLDLVHRTYESDESFRSLDFMVHTRLWGSQVVLQIFICTLVPLALLALTQLFRIVPAMRRAMYLVTGLLVMIGIFAMRWNVVIGGQLFSKSFLGYTSFKLEFAAREGLLMGIGLMILPFVIFVVLVKLLPPWPERKTTEALGD